MKTRFNYLIAIMIIVTLLPFGSIANAAPAPQKDNYYFVYNSTKVDAKDLAAIKQFMVKFKGTKNISFDAKGYTSAASLYDALKAYQKKVGGNVAGIQIFGIQDDVPSFPYVHKMKVMEGNERWDGVEHNKNESYVTDAFYSNFKSDSKFLKNDVTVHGIIQGGQNINIVPEWPVSRLPLSKGEIAGYFTKYDAYLKQVKGKTAPTVVLSAPSIFQDGHAQNDVAFFMNRLKKENELFKTSEFRPYYKDLNANVVKENKAGIMDLMVASTGDNQGATQNKTLFFDRNTVTSKLNSNYYTMFFWSMSGIKGLGKDNIVHDGLTKGKMINPISHTVTASNGGMANVLWAPVEQDPSGMWLNDYVPVTPEMIDAENNPYFFITEYYTALEEGKGRFQSFYEAKVAYAKMSVKNRKVPSASFGYENVISLHYLGLADPK